MNRFHMISDAQGILFSKIGRGIGGRLMAGTDRYFIPPLAKTIERSAQKSEGFPSVLTFPGSGRRDQCLGNLRIFDLISGEGMKLRTRTLNLVALAMLSGCAQLPLDGPAKQDIVTGASATLANPPQAVVLDYALVDINPIVLGCLDDVETGSFSKTFGGRAPAVRAGVGDVLGVSVFESSSGPFAPVGGSGGGGSAGGGSAGASRQSNNVTTTLTVDSSGMISVPYAGGIQAAGKKLPEIEREIESKLANRLVEPQVVLSMVEDNAGGVTVVGDSSSSRVRLSGSGERILDVVAKAGGFKYPAYDTDIILQRKKRVATAYLPTLIRNPEENIFVQPDDVIYVNRNQRTFVASGALGASTGYSAVGAVTGGTGSNVYAAVGLFSFDKEHLSLNEGIGKAGGLLDYRADPAQVFVHRLEHRRTLEGMGVDLGRFAPDQKLIPTIYRANFRDPSAFLFAQRFPMRNKDTIYVGNADANEVAKLFGYITLWTGTAATVAVNANTVAHGGP